MRSKFFKDKSEPIYTPPYGTPVATRPDPNIYRLMGEDNIREMIKDFYLKLGQSEIAGMFPRNLVKASEKSALFFIGLLGGPPLYMQKYGPPRMRARHFPFRITRHARNVWLACFEATLADSDKYQFPREYLEDFKQFLGAFSLWMVNTED